MMTKNKGCYEKYFKRLLDILLSSLALIVLSPVMLVVALLIKTKLGSPVIFKQERPGKDEKIFSMYKFRTMTSQKDEHGNLLPDIQRLTKFGRLLRNTSLDELPELFNIIKGDMSFVGPRPLLVKYLPLYNSEQRQRHSVKPGLTGLAQVKGRNVVTWEERLKLDVQYSKNVSCFCDIKIIVLTFITVLKREGIDSKSTEKVTMEEFKGTK